jgi:hypothetical protein
MDKDDGRLLALGLVGAMAAAAGLRRDRGSSVRTILPSGISGVTPGRMPAILFSDDTDYYALYELVKSKLWEEINVEVHLKQGSIYTGKIQIELADLKKGTGDHFVVHGEKKTTVGPLDDVAAIVIL